MSGNLNESKSNLKYIQPTETSVLSSVEPLSAAFLSVFWLHVSFGLPEWLGTVCIIGTIIILSRVKIVKKQFKLKFFTIQK